MISMADLDEALFPIPSVLDFTATLSREESLEQLRVSIKLLKEDYAVGPLAHEALETIPSIKAARENGQLRVLVSTSGTDCPTRGAAKRSIQDRR